MIESIATWVLPFITLVSMLQYLIARRVRNKEEMLLLHEKIQLDMYPEFNKVTQQYVEASKEKTGEEIAESYEAYQWQ